MLLLKITDGANANEPQDHSEKCNKELERLKQIKENQNIGILSIINLPCTKDLHSQ